ncbi:Uncharacterized protein dnm_020370 [Desulfonema magnum]|uniref:Uncharacterized protein n=1 Tax=Desulfonema magnum TaxID=45655 RepID=A0A975BJ06_9BACT|nr:Uncharacterized protein dnm_020370 [Desulfonema magnum]
MNSWSLFQPLKMAGGSIKNIICRNTKLAVFSLFIPLYHG